MSYCYNLKIADEAPRSLIIGWLMLAVFGLLSAGLYAVMLVLSRAPVTKDIFPWVDFFKTALIVHVDFTVVVWLFSFAAVFWCINSKRYLENVGYIALAIATAGALLIGLSPFVGDANPLINNYVPVLQNPTFFLGLLLFGVGFLIIVGRSLLVPASFELWRGEESTIRFAIYTTAFIALLAIGVFLWTWAFIPPDIESGKEYFEVLFWGVGHTVQYMHTLLMVAAWLWLAGISGVRISLYPAWTNFFIVFGFWPLLLTPVSFITYDVGHYEMKQWFTWLMTMGGPLTAVPLGLVIVWAMLRNWRVEPEVRVMRVALWLSIILFFGGGWLAMMIDQSSTLITAHYHGSTVAITTAYMAVAYHLLRELNFVLPNMRVAFWQIVCYGVGTILFMIGFGWAGTMGMGRKIAGAEQVLDGAKMTAMAIYGLGGAISIIGGFLFVALVVPAMIKTLRRNRGAA